MSTARDDPGGSVVPPLHVLVVAYGDPDALDRCLGALAGRYPVVVVDNSSSARTRAVAERAGASYIDPGENLGFAAGVNRGLRVVARPGVDILLLNPDAVIEVDDLERLRRALHAGPGVACVAPAQRRPGSDRASPVCWPFPTPGRAWAEAVGLGRFTRRWGYVIASVLVVRAEAFIDVGGLDERFFLYAEEADWERRATRRGWRVSYCPEAAARHVGAATDPDPDRRQIRFHAGVETYVRKWHGALGWRSYQVATVVTALRRAAVSRRRRGPSLSLARLYARGPVAVALQGGLIPRREHRVPLFDGGESPP